VSNFCGWGDEVEFSVVDAAITSALTELRRVREYWVTADPDLHRGIPFGDPFDPAAGKNHGPDSARGLVFTCYQASVGDQFDFLQNIWAANSDFPGGGDGPDPVIGPAGTAAIPGSSTEPVNLGRFVAVEVALYALTRSIPTLELLASGANLPVS
jgi:hypothetical protein